MAGMDDLFDDESLDDLVDTALLEADTTDRIDAGLLKPKKSRRAPRLTARSREDDTMDETVDAASTPHLETTKPHRAALGSRSTAAMPEMTFDSIYQRAGLTTDADSFTVYRLRDLYDDEEIAALEQTARVVAVKAVLKSHNVEIERIFDDAVARRDALESHDGRLRQNIERVEQQVEQENSALQAEIEEFANPRLQRMEANEERLRRLRRDYERWYDRMAAEQTNLAGILEPWGGDDRMKVTARLELPERAAAKDARSQEPYALSGADVFDDTSGPGRPIEPPADEPKVQIADEWSMGSEVEEIGAESSERHADAASDFDLDGPTHTYEADAGASLSDEFSFRPRYRTPDHAWQGVLAFLAVMVWIAGGVLLTAYLAVDLLTPLAWGIGLGAPVLLAFVFSTVFRRGGWFSGWFMMLLYFSVVAGAVAHAEAQKLVTSLTQDPLVFVSELGAADEVSDLARRATVPYARFVANAFPGVEMPQSSTAQPPSVPTPEGGGPQGAP